MISNVVISMRCGSTVHNYASALSQSRNSNNVLFQFTVVIFAITLRSQIIYFLVGGSL